MPSSNRRQPEYSGPLGASEHSLALSEADTMRLRAWDARRRDEIETAQGMNVAPQSGPVFKPSTANVDYQDWARDKALRDVKYFFMEAFRGKLGQQLDGWPAHRLTRTVPMLLGKVFVQPEPPTSRWFSSCSIALRVAVHILQDDD